MTRVTIDLTVKPPTVRNPYDALLPRAIDELLSAQRARRSDYVLAGPAEGS